MIFIYIFSIANYSQLQRNIDFTKCNAVLKINATEKKISGQVTYVFNAKSINDSISIDAKNMTITNFKVNNKVTLFKNNLKTIRFIDNYNKGNNIISFDYAATPKQTLYFVDSPDGKQIWTQGQGKYTSHWFPSFDDVTEKLVFNLSIIYDKASQVVSNGFLISETAQSDGTVLWNYQMEHQMSSYLLMLAIGNYENTAISSESHCPLQFFIEPNDKPKFEPTFRHSKTIFDFLEKEIGVKYPWKIYKQIPVRDFLYAGMENTTATLFSRDFVVDSIARNDRNYTNVNAHELAHHWFGDLVTAQTGKDHWLQEGFATFYAMLAEEQLYGKNYYYWKLYEMAEDLQKASQNDRIPILSEKASSLSYYQKGAWALVALRNDVGNAAFKKIIKKYLETYSYETATTADFLEIVKKITNYDTTTFQKVWLESTSFPVDIALNYLKKSKCIQDYFAIAEMKDQALKDKETYFLSIINDTETYAPIKVEIIYQLQDASFDAKKKIIMAAMATNDLQIRQAIAQNVTTFPDDFKKQYETLLTDSSYITNEIALKVLWTNYPDEQANLLEKTKHWIGFNDYNLRIEWFTLALRTKAIATDAKLKYYNELLLYASPKFESNTRQNALTNLIFLDKNDQNYLIFLVDALIHPKWQFTKFAREKIREMLKSKSHRTYFENLLNKESGDEIKILSKLLQEKRD